MKKNADDFIKDKILKILGICALQGKNDIEHVKQNMLYILWRMRGQIHNIEKNLLQDLTFDSGCNSCESSDDLALKVSEIAKQYLKPLLENKKWSDDDLK